MDDFSIRGAQVCLPGGMTTVDVMVSDGKIAALGEGLSARREFDAAGLLLLPGAMDAHGHYNEPGRTDWEGWATGSLASAAGGASCVFEMPLNAHPPTLDAESFALKRAAAEASSVVDFALWGGLTPVNLNKLDELAECGAVGFKAFMTSSGMSDFPRANHTVLREGMKRAAALGLPVAVHAEDDEMVSVLAQEALARGRTGMRDYLRSRPVAAEVKAIREACNLAGETGCKLHVVHISSGEGLAAVAKAKTLGVDVSAETCPHYLLFNDEDAMRLGAAAKCAPPLRPETIRADLLTRVCREEIDTLGTDHSPCPPSMREGNDFFKIWGGIMGAQQFLPALFAAGLDAPKIARLTGSNVARRFGFEGRKGIIAEGYDADLVLIHPQQKITVEKKHLLTRHPTSPYIGYTFPASIRCVWVRGQRAWSAEAGPGQSHGKLIRPENHP